MRIKLSFGLLVTAAVLFGLGGQAMALHHGGVAHCDACHTMHNSFEGASVIDGGTVGTTNDYLLIGGDQSSTCLNCHYSTSAGSYHIDGPYTADVGPLNKTPGGDFAWVNKDFTWSGRSGTSTSKGDRHGHNIVAVDFSHAEDGDISQAPGGTYPADSLHCSSCHDPHGRYRILDDAGTIATTGKPIGHSGSYANRTNAPTATEAAGVYRFLAGIGYEPKSTPGYAFTANPPNAMVQSTYNRTEEVTQTRVAYGSGMSAWCSNCHTLMHNDNYDTVLRHPSGQAITDEVVDNYNAYVKSGDLSNVDVTLSYLSLTPFESGHDFTAADRLLLQDLAANDDTVLDGPVKGEAQVMCLSCHRAHASGWDSMTRWDMSDEELTVASAWTGAGRTATENQNAYNGRLATDFATYQRSFCNKCHAKD